jgi:hypothetical protein
MTTATLTPAAQRTAAEQAAFERESNGTWFRIPRKRINQFVAEGIMQTPFEPCWSAGDYSIRFTEDGLEIGLIYCFNWNGYSHARSFEVFRAATNPEFTDDSAQGIATAANVAALPTTIRDLANSPASLNRAAMKQHMLNAIAAEVHETPSTIARTVAFTESVVVENVITAVEVAELIHDLRA